MEHKIFGQLYAKREESFYTEFHVTIKKQKNIHMKKILLSGIVVLVSSHIIRAT